MRREETQLIDDERRVKRTRSPWSYFFGERMHSADMKGIALKERTRLASDEWKALSAEEKQVSFFPLLGSRQDTRANMTQRFEDLAAADKQRYARETSV
jgi:hypothetical protein